MNTTELKGNWEEQKGKLKQRFAILTEDDLLFAGANITNAGAWKLTNGGSDYELTNQSDNSKRYFHIIELNPASASVSEDSGTKEYHLLKN